MENKNSNPFPVAPEIIVDKEQNRAQNQQNQNRAQNQANNQSRNKAENKETDCHKNQR